MSLCKKRATSLAHHQHLLLAFLSRGSKINMACTKWTTPHLLHIRELLRQGLSFGQIAVQTSISKSAVTRFANQMTDVDFDKSLGGRPPLLSSCQCLLLVRGIKQKSYTSATEASAYWLQHYQVQLSRQTITREFKRAGLKFRVKQKNPSFSSNIKGHSLPLHSAMLPGPTTTGRTSSGMMNARCNTLEKGWRSGTGQRRQTTLYTYLHSKVAAIMTSESYCKLLEEALPGSILKWKSIQQIPPKSRMLFMQNNASPHCTNNTKEYLQEVGWNVLPWPAMSPDLNPIEHVWQQLKKRLYMVKHTLRTKEELVAAIVTFWETYPKKSAQALIKSMPRRLQAVKKARGGHTKD
ncbi:related to Transposase [Sporisorium reilianum f. sp. reilianum]|uniref:Related to Transposase n=1 Tax=Sporisorium reilianum f. sp. reilianum TaxID=72559 RepID=A0A2N8UDH6_9BASI|nr:related to Transposase [Sporisorium reilianum f. sp. reilianum]